MTVSCHPLCMTYHVMSGFLVYVEVVEVEISRDILADYSKHLIANDLFSKNDITTLQAAKNQIATSPIESASHHAYIDFIHPVVLFSMESYIKLCSSLCSREHERSLVSHPCAGADEYERDEPNKRQGIIIMVVETQKQNECDNSSAKKDNQWPKVWSHPRHYEFPIPLDKRVVPVLSDLRDQMLQNMNCVLVVIL